MKKIGLTGGIGSGKSFIAAQFASLGIPVFYSDIEARKLYLKPEVREQVNQLADTNVFLANGMPDKPAFAELLFKNPGFREKLNALIHPMVRKCFEDFCATHTDKPYVVNEAALLVESGSWKTLDALILVTAPEFVRVQRVMQRDAVSAEQVLDRMRSQWSDEAKLSYATYCIVNDGRENTASQVAAIDRELRT